MSPRLAVRSRHSSKGSALGIWGQRNIRPLRVHCAALALGPHFWHGGCVLRVPDLEAFNNSGGKFPTVQCRGARGSVHSLAKIGLAALRRFR